MTETNSPNAARRIDIASLGGLAVAVGSILAGLLLEGGRLKDVGQVTAALIVLGGTMGAVMVTHPGRVLLGALRRLRSVFFEPGYAAAAVVEEIIGYATKARKSGLVSLEQEAERVPDPFLRKALNLAVDGTDLQDLRHILELEIGVREQESEAEAKVFEAAGGYAPTIGIIGAVLGLIQVMKNLANIDEVGRGIAVAFVATVYGVGSANLFFLPAANKIKARIRKETERKELMLEGVVAILEGMNPKLIRSRLEVYLAKPQSQPAPAARKNAAVQAAAVET